MIATLRSLGLVLLAAFCCAAGAQTQPPKVLNVEGKVLDIVGVSRGVESALFSASDHSAGRSTCRPRRQPLTHALE